MIVDLVPIDDSKDHQNHLKVLDWRLRKIPVATTVEELYQLATLIYLDRTSNSLLDQPLKIQQHIDKAFAVFSQLDCCERQFPLFVLGCEARTDEQRAIILDLISRTEANAASRSLSYVNLMLQAIWAQDDLVDEPRNLNYADKLGFTMSRCAIPPCFA